MNREAGTFGRIVELTAPRQAPMGSAWVLGCCAVRNIAA
jgi:hypothetical protein